MGKLLEIVTILNDKMKSNANRLDDIENQLNPLNITLNINPSLVEVGTTTNVNLSWSYSRQDIIFQSLDAEELDETLRSKSISSVSANRTFILQAKTQSGLTKSASNKITFVNASYYGVVNTLTPTPEEIKALSKLIISSKSLTRTVNLNNQRVAFAYPASFGTLSSIKDANNFDYINSYTRTEISIDNVSYYLYVLTDPVTIEGFKQSYS